MSAQFASAYIRTQTPTVDAYGFTVAMWVLPQSTGTKSCFWSASETDRSGNGNYWTVGQSAGNAWQIETLANGLHPTSETGGTVTANKWAFVVARFISAYNRQLDILQFDGSIASVSSGDLSNPTNIDSEQIGALFDIATSPTNLFDGMIAEFWKTKTDIQGDGAALDARFLRQLAFGGPFSVPHVAQSVMEYRSFASTVAENQGDGEEIYYGNIARTLWQNAGATLGPHCPLPYWYKKPKQASQILMIESR